MIKWENSPFVLVSSLSGENKALDTELNAVLIVAINDNYIKIFYVKAQKWPHKYPIGKYVSNIL